MKKIDDAVLGVLSRLSYDVDKEAGHTVAFINDGQLDPKLYKKLDEVLKSLGGKWNRHKKGHVFADNPHTKIDAALITGEFQETTAFDFFETPYSLAQRMVEEAGIRDLPEFSTVLEPSAGRGGIADAIRAVLPGNCRLDLCELREDNRQVLEDKGYKVGAYDFMGARPMHDEGVYDRIVMNPPFSKQQDIDHVLHAFLHLKTGGKLVAIMSAGVRFRENKRAVAFRERVDECGHIEDLPEGTFKGSGTMVNTVLVTMEK